MTEHETSPARRTPDAADPFAGSPPKPADGGLPRDEKDRPIVASPAARQGFGRASSPILVVLVASTLMAALLLGALYLVYWA